MDFGIRPWLDDPWFLTDLGRGLAIAIGFGLRPWLDGPWFFSGFR